MSDQQRGVSLTEQAVIAQAENSEDVWRSRRVIKLPCAGSLIYFRLRIVNCVNGQINPKRFNMDIAKANNYPLKCKKQS